MPYRGLTASLATQHGKERAIAPAFAAMTGIGIAVPAGLDTDRFGTFTGETPRHASMRETARLKARLGMEAAGLPLGIASEGSFGPHPVLPFLACGRETLVFVDDLRGLEVFEEDLSETTNFAALDLAPGADVEGFLVRAGFPSHAVVLRRGEEIIKGIDNRDDLARHLASVSGRARLETDMRAHVNPTRMGEIARLAARLACRLARPCPACAAPGFGPVRSEAGLACVDCGTPGPLVRHIVWGCTICPHEQRLPRDDNRETASAAECLECNP